jgi:hypothetical protein
MLVQRAAVPAGRLAHAGDPADIGASGRELDGYEINPGGAWLETANSFPNVIGLLGGIGGARVCSHPCLDLDGHQSGFQPHEQVNFAATGPDVTAHDHGSVLGKVGGRQGLSEAGNPSNG